jgi:Domain of unknown function (DUF1857)
MSQCTFKRSDGGVITNVISLGTNGPSDVYLTFTFSIPFPNIKEEGGQEAQEEKANFTKIGYGAVQATVDTVRHMVKDGKL